MDVLDIAKSAAWVTCETEQSAHRDGGGHHTVRRDREAAGMTRYD
jgi:hypothetical protein